MKISVPDAALDHFWNDEPEEGQQEFWAFRWPVKAKVGDTIYFRSGNRVIATAVIDRIEPPGASSCSTTGKFKSLWKVFWNPSTFKDERLISRLM